MCHQIVGCSTTVRAKSLGPVSELLSGGAAGRIVVRPYSEHHAADGDSGSAVLLLMWKDALDILLGKPVADSHEELDPMFL